MPEAILIGGPLQTEPGRVSHVAHLGREIRILHARRERLEDSMIEPPGWLDTVNLASVEHRYVRTYVYGHFSSGVPVYVHDSLVTGSDRTPVHGELTGLEQVLVEWLRASVTDSTALARMRQEIEGWRDTVDYYRNDRNARAREANHWRAECAAYRAIGAATQEWHSG